MFKKLFVFSISLLLVVVFLHSPSFAQNDIDVELITGGSATCTFKGRVPFKRIKAANNNLVTNTNTGKTDVSIESELDTEKNTITANIFAVIEAVSNPIALLSGQEIEFQSNKFEFSISKIRKSDGALTEVTNETPEGERTNVTGNVLVKSFDNTSDQVSGVLRMVFENTFKTIEKLDEDIETDENGKVTVTCKFENVPVNFSN